MGKTWDKQGGNFFPPKKEVDIVDQLSWASGLWSSAGHSFLCIGWPLGVSAEYKLGHFLFTLCVFPVTGILEILM